MGDYFIDICKRCGREYLRHARYRRRLCEACCLDDYKETKYKEMKANNPLPHEKKKEATKP